MYKTINMRWVAAVLLAMPMAGCLDLDTPCGNELRSEKSSPDGIYTAALFIQNCGATVGFSSVVSVRKTTAVFDGNAKETYVFLTSGKEDMDLRWDTQTVLEVRHKVPAANIYIQVPALGDVRIVHKQE